MEHRKALSQMPENLKKYLLEKELISGKPLIFAEADMTLECEFLHHVLILTDKGLTVGSAPELTKELIKNTPSPKREREWERYSFENYPLDCIKKCATDSLVVGGVLRLELDGVERPLCAYTNAYKGGINRICDVLKLLMDGKDIPEDKLFREERIEKCPKCGRRYPNRDRKVCPKCMDKRKIFFRLGSFFKPYAPQIVLMCLMSVLTAAMSTVWPYLNGSILYDGVLSKNKNILFLDKIPVSDFFILLGLLAVTMAGCKLLQQLFGIIQGRAVARVVPSVVSTIKKKVFGSIQRLSVSFFTNKRTGGLMTRITADANQVSDIFIDGIPHVLPNLFTLGFAFIVMFSTNWILALTAVVSLPIAAFISFKLQPRMWHYNSKMHQTSRDYRARFNDNLVGARVVRAFGMESHEEESLSAENDRTYDAQYSAMKFDIKFSALYEIAKSLTALLVWGVGVCFVLAVFKPQMTYGQLVTFTGYVSLLSDPANFFSHIFRWWSGSMTAAQRIFEIIDAKPDVVETTSPVEVKDLKGELKLENVTFGYEENREVIKDVCLDVPAGKMLGIVGKSGAGKSTLANLITRLYDPNSGHIYIDGTDIREMSFADIRRSVALVSQETYIFRGTIFENIAYANPNADKRDVLNAAMAAFAHDFICKLPDGYDTFVGTGGRSLSGGERQRVSIARAILADPKILILDEATAAVDTETERNIQSALEKLSVGRTTLSIAHRISTLRDADMLVVVEDGKIVEQGTHDELIRKKGTYFKLVQIQNEALKLRGIGD